MIYKACCTQYSSVLSTTKFINGQFGCILNKWRLLTNYIFINSNNSPSTQPLYRGTQIVWYILGLIEVLLAFRFVLKFLGANATAGFTNFIYNITYPFTLPFNTVFSRTEVAGSIFEWTTILAMFVYWVVAIGIIRIFLMGRTVSTPEAAAKLDQQDN